jgi:MFS family permease
VLSLSGVASVAGRLVFGWLGDFADKRRLVAGVVVLQTIAILALAIADSLPLVIVYAVAFGLGWGGSIPLRSAIILERFGRKAFGTIQGTFFFLATTASTISPIFVGQVFDMTQNYRPAFFALGGFLMVTGPLILLVRLRPAR